METLFGVNVRDRRNAVENTIMWTAVLDLAHNLVDVVPVLKTSAMSMWIIHAFLRIHAIGLEEVVRLQVRL